MMTDTCGANRDVALLPFPYQGCVAPESAPITWISTEVVFANIPILFVCLIWPLQALFSRNWFWFASHVVSASFSILSYIQTSWQKMFLDAIDSRELPVHHISTDIYKSKRKHVISFMLWPVPTSPHFSSPFSFTELIKGFVAPSYLVEKASTAVYLLDWLKTSLTFLLGYNFWWNLLEHLACSSTIKSSPDSRAVFSKLSMMNIEPPWNETQCKLDLFGAVHLLRNTYLGSWETPSP